MPSWPQLPKCAHARMPFEPGFAHFEFPIVCSSVSLAHPSELSLLRGNAPLAPASPHTPTWHLSYRLSCSSERRFLPHPTHILSGCLKFYYLFPLPRAGPTKEEREIDTHPPHLYPLVFRSPTPTPPTNRGALLSVPFPTGLAAPESLSLTLDVAVQGNHSRPFGAAERRVVDVVGQGGGEAGWGRP